MKIRNVQMKNLLLTVSNGAQVQFNAKGEAEVDDELGDQLVQLNGYVDTEAIPSDDEDTPTAEETPAEEPAAAAGDVPEEVADEDTSTSEDDNTDDESDDKEDLVEELQKMSIVQIRKYAKEHNIDLAGAAKKDEIIAIIVGASE